MTSTYLRDGESLKAGEYEIKAGASMKEIMDLLKSGKSIQYSLTLPEGLTVKQMFKKIADDPNLDAMLDLHRMIGREPVIAQKFIPAVSKGDKRILLVDGHPVGAINRVPDAGQIRSNLAVGGRAEAVELTDRDRELCEIIGPELKRRGLMFVGIDVIGDYLTEINVTSPTGARALERFTGVNATAILWDAIEAARTTA